MSAELIVCGLEWTGAEIIVVGLLGSGVFAARPAQHGVYGASGG